MKKSTKKGGIPHKKVSKRTNLGPIVDRLSNHVSDLPDSIPEIKKPANGEVEKSNSHEVVVLPQINENHKRNLFSRIDLFGVLSSGLLILIGLELIHMTISINYFFGWMPATSVPLIICLEYAMKIKAVSGNPNDFSMLSEVKKKLKLTRACTSVLLIIPPVDEYFAHHYLATFRVVVDVIITLLLPFIFDLHLKIWGKDIK
jgi:hypothetical protein